jgi:hypothetical protein
MYCGNENPRLRIPAARPETWLDEPRPGDTTARYASASASTARAWARPPGVIVCPAGSSW